MMNPKAAKLLAEAFMASQGPATKIQEVLHELDCSPMALAFAFEVLEAGITQNVPDWRKIRGVARQSFQAMREDGLVPPEPVSVDGAEKTYSDDQKPLETQAIMARDVDEAVTLAVNEREPSLLEYEMMSRRDPNDSRYVRIVVSPITKEDFENETVPRSDR